MAVLVQYLGWAPTMGESHRDSRHAESSPRHWHDGGSQAVSGFSESVEARSSSPTPESGRHCRRSESAIMMTGPLAHGGDPPGGARRDMAGGVATGMSPAANRVSYSYLFQDLFLLGLTMAGSRARAQPTPGG